MLQQNILADLFPRELNLTINDDPVWQLYNQQQPIFDSQILLEEVYEMLNG
jgi:hypothetical protein